MPSFNQLPRPGLTPSKKKLKMSNSLFDFSSFTKEHEQPTPDQPIDPLPPPMPINHQLKMSDSFLGGSTEPPRGFDSSTMVVEGGHYPDFFPLMVDAPSPITVKAPPCPTQPQTRPTHRQPQTCPTHHQPRTPTRCQPRMQGKAARIMQQNK